MKKQQSRVESYVPASSFYEGKREVEGRAFRDRFAVVDLKKDFSVLASRGKDLQIGQPLPLDREQIPLLRVSLARGERVLAKAGVGSALFFGDLIWNDLAPVLLLSESCADLATAAELIFHREIVTLGEKEEPKIGRRELSDLCLHLSQTLAECDRAFSETGEQDSFRIHAAHVAAFAGCRADFSELSFEPFPLSALDGRKWTMLLLCLFLSLRGFGGEAPNFTMREVGRELIFPGVDLSISKDAKRQTDERFSFLRHPAFRDVELETTQEGLRLSVILARRSQPGELRAAVPVTRFCFLLEAA